MVLWFAARASAGSGDLRVELVCKERGSGVPVVGAAVEVDGAVLEVDADGHVGFDHPPGTFEVRITSPEHLPATVALTLVDEGVTEGVWLRRITWEQELTVYGHREDDAVQHQVVSIDELRRVPGSFGDPVRAMQSLPSVARPRSVEGALVVRGAEASTTGVYVDGVQVPFLFHLLAGKSVLSPSLVDSVDFYPGGMPARYGDVAQAVVDARTSDAPFAPGGIHGAAHVDLMEIGLGAEVPLPGAFELTLSGRASWLSSVVRAGQLVAVGFADPGEGRSRPGGLRVPYSDAYARLQHPAGAGRVYATVFGADDGIHVIPERDDLDGDGRWDPVPEVPEGKVDATDLLENRFSRAVVGWDGDSERVRYATTLSVGRDGQRNLIQGLGLFASAPQDVDVETDIGWFTHGNRVALSDHWAVATGVDARIRAARLQALGVGPNGDDEGPIVTDRQLWLGPYGGLELTAGPLWVSPGVRGAIHHLADRWTQAVEPRGSVRVALSDRVSARGFVGTFSQAPTADRYALDGAPAKLIRGFQTAAGAEVRGGAWIGSVDVYRTTFADLVVPSDEPVLILAEYQFDQTLGFDPVFDVTTGESVGAEVLLRRLPSGGWFGWLSVSAGRSTRLVDGVAVPSDYDTPLDATLVLARDLPRSWGVSAKVRAGVGQPFTPSSGVYVSGVDAWLPVTGDPNSDRYPPFFQLDLRIDKTWTARRSRWTVYLDLYNATNQPNPLLASYDWDYSNRVTTAWVPTLPAIGAEVTF